MPIHWHSTSVTTTETATAAARGLTLKYAHLTKFHVVIANDDEEKLLALGNYKADGLLCQNELGEDLLLKTLNEFSLISDRTIYHKHTHSVPFKLQPANSSKIIINATKSEHTSLIYRCTT